MGQSTGRDRDGLHGAGYVGELELDLLDSGLPGGGDQAIDRPAVQIAHAAVALLLQAFVIGLSSRAASIGASRRGCSLE